MSFIKNPSEIEEKKNLVMMVYGEPGQGKTTLALSCPSPVLIDTDGGVGRTLTSHRCPTVQVTSWEDVEGALAEIKAGPFQTIIVDTVGKLLDFMSEYITRKNPKMGKGTKLTLQGYGERKAMFRDFVKGCFFMQRNIVFIAHAEESKVGEDIVVRPIVGGSSLSDVMNELDLMGLLVNIAGKRLLMWGNDGTALSKSFYTKNTCFLPNVMEVPAVADANGNIIRKNDMLSAVIDQFRKAQKEKEAVSKKYDKLINDARKLINTAENVDQLNKLRETFAETEHIFDSKMVMGLELNERAKALNCKFDKTENAYVSAEVQTNALASQ